jgi:alpha-beta hydrolase superfamily lysophospholipase
MPTRTEVVAVHGGGRDIALTVVRPTGRVRARVAFSHGAFSSPAKYAPLLQGWAAAGLMVAAPLHVDGADHPDRASYDQGQVWRARLEDQQATLDWLAADGKGGLAAAGHSFGALLALAAGGARVLAPDDLAPIADRRVRAVIALSPPPAMPGLITAEGFAGLKVPALVQTGDADVLPGFVDDWRSRLIAWEAAVPGDKHALVLDGVDHYFGGLICRPELPGPHQTAGFNATLAASIDLMLAHAAGDVMAAEWLRASVTAGKLTRR